MDVAVIGAGGEVGREMCAQLIESGIVGPGDELCLVGHVGGPSELAVFGLVVDLADAFAEYAPNFHVTSKPEDLRDHLIVFVAGASVPHDSHDAITRQDLSRRNVPVFQSWARRLASVTSGDELMIIQSNPVELAVQVMSVELGSARVLGGAAFSDTLRLRRELARDAGVHRQDVSAMVLGQHGPNLMPVWSQVAVRGWDRARTAALVEKVTANRLPNGFPDEMVAALGHLIRLLQDDAGHECIAFLRELPADLRAAVKPFFVHYTGRTTAVVTAHAVVELARIIGSGSPSVVPAQVALDGAWDGFTAPVGVPVELGHHGWLPVSPDLLNSAELERLRTIHAQVELENASALAAR